MATNNKNTRQVNAKLTTCMLSQDFQPEHWDWDDTEKQSLVDCAATAQVILNRLEAEGLTVIEAYLIHHNKDEHKIWLEYDNRYITKFTSDHIHLVFKFPKDGGETRERIAEIIGVDINYIEKPKPGRYSYSNLLCYLIHMKYPNKYQYDPYEVITLRGKSYIEHYREKYESWKRGRAERIFKDAQISLKELKIMIIDGEVTRKDLRTKPEFKYVYLLNKTKLDNFIEENKQYWRDREYYLSGKLKD